MLDLGCGAGALLERLIREDYELVVGADVVVRALEQAARRLKLDEMHDAQRQRISLLQSPLTYRDKRLVGFDAAALVEVIEHLDPPRLAAAEQNVFGSARPGTVVVTTPNAEYNVRWETLPGGELPPSRPPLRMDTRASSRRGRRAVAEPARLRGALRAGRPRGPGGRSADADGGVQPMRIDLPDPSLVVLIGAVGLGQELVRAQALRADRGDLLGLLPRPGRRRRERPERHEGRVRGPAASSPARRLAQPRFTVVDATNVQREARRPLIELAKAARPVPGRDRARHPRGGLPGAQPLAAGPRLRTARRAPAAHRSCTSRSKGLQREGFRRVAVLRSAEEVDGAEVHRAPLWTDRRADHGPFDIIGDVHGCHAELAELLRELGYQVDGDGVTVTPPDGRRAVFVGDYGDRGPDTPGVLKLVMSMADAGTAICLPGNHDIKLVAQAQGPRRPDHPRPRRDARAARSRSRTSSASRPATSSTGSSATSCSTTASSSSRTPG